MMEIGEAVNDVTVSTTSSISGRGTIQVGRLAQWLSGFPRDAEIVISTPTDPGGNWALATTVRRA